MSGNRDVFESRTDTTLEIGPGGWSRGATQVPGQSRFCGPSRGSEARARSRRPDQLRMSWDRAYDIEPCSDNPLKKQWLLPPL